MPGIFSKEFWTGSDPYKPTEYQPGAGFAAQQAIRGGPSAGMGWQAVGGAPGGPSQYNLAEMLMARARGEAPSAAEEAMKTGLASAQRSAAGAMAGRRGINPGQAARMALAAQTSLGSQAFRGGAVLRAQEQAGAEQALGQHLYGMRGQDLAQEQQRLGAWGQYQGMRMQAQPGSTGFLGNLLGTGIQAAGAYFGMRGAGGGAPGGAGAGGTPWSPTSGFVGSGSRSGSSYPDPYAGRLR